MPSDLVSSSLRYPRLAYSSCTVFDCIVTIFAQQTVAFGFWVGCYSHCSNQFNFIIFHPNRIGNEMYAPRLAFLRLRPWLRIAAVRQHYKSYEEIKNNLIWSIRLNHLGRKYVWFLSCEDFVALTSLVCQFLFCTTANLPSRNWIRHLDGNRHNVQSLYADHLLLLIFSPKFT